VNWIRSNHCLRVRANPFTQHYLSNNKNNEGRMSEPKQVYGEIKCECGKPAELTPAEAEAYLEARSHFPFIAPPKCKDCRETRAV
jgi:hypothetical protein